jgi:tRNA-binding EMAP/Myf-like protein
VTHHHHHHTITHTNKAPAFTRVLSLSLHAPGQVEVPGDAVSAEFAARYAQAHGKPTAVPAAVPAPAAAAAAAAAVSTSAAPAAPVAEAAPKAAEPTAKPKKVPHARTRLAPWPAIHTPPGSPVLARRKPRKRRSKKRATVQLQVCETASAARPSPPANIGAPAGNTDAPADLIARVDFRVGLITEAKMHPDADSLYVETSALACAGPTPGGPPRPLTRAPYTAVDLGEPEPRTVISGLANYVPLEQMQNRLIVLCANLKPRPYEWFSSAAFLIPRHPPHHCVGCGGLGLGMAAQHARHPFAGHGHVREHRDQGGAHRTTAWQQAGRRHFVCWLPA